MLGRLLLSIALLQLNGSQALASRPQLSEQEINARMPIIFEGKVLKAGVVKAPVHDLYLYGQTEALEVKLKVLRAWKGIAEETVAIYTWPPGKAPCNASKPAIQEKNLVRAEWDSTRRYVLFDICRNFSAVDENTKPRVELLDQMYPRAESKAR